MKIHAIILPSLPPRATLLRGKRMGGFSVLFAFVFFTFFSGCGPSERHPKSPSAVMLNKACAWLWSKQADDGGWHSEDHGILRGGQAYTPFILYALMQVPDSVYPLQQVKMEKAMNYLRNHISQTGVLGISDPDVLEYPNYSTAYALRVFAKAGKESDKALVEKMQGYLANQQFDESRGFYEEQYEFGGWGFGETDLAFGKSGQVDLSHTRRALQGLRESGWKDSATYAQAKIFLRLLQKRPDEWRFQPCDTTRMHRTPYDGGLYYSPIQIVMNKAGIEKPKTNSTSAFFLSYGSATSDGLLALIAAGYPAKTDSHCLDAFRWLQSHERWDINPGIPEDHPENWENVMRLYHCASRAEAYKAMGAEGKWKLDLVAFLATQQHTDGSFANPEGAINKEDDPLLGTALGVLALVSIL